MGARSYTSPRTGHVQENGHTILPSFCRAALPRRLFSDEGSARSSQSFTYMCGGGIGDKIYCLPALYVYDGVVGTLPDDEPIFRLVKGKTRPFEAQDLPVTVGLGMHGELVDEIADRLEVLEDLALKMPVLETTEAEKRKMLGKDRYVVLAMVASGPKRTWLEAEAEIQRRITDRQVVVLHRHSLDNFAWVERADCVISVNTSFIPMAAGFQVPTVAIDAADRTAYMLDVENVPRDVDAVVEAYERLMAKRRPRCWCGSRDGTSRVSGNVYVKTCVRCGTDWQEARATMGGIDAFYRDHYHYGWRELVEGEVPYQDRVQRDRDLAVTRLEQWEPVSGNTWLDVGAGNGALVDVLNENGWKAAGIEPGGQLGHASVRQTWDELGTFDVLSYVDVLEHADIPVEMERIRRHLNDGGTLVLELPVAQEQPKHYRRLQHLVFFTDTSAGKMLRHFGFKVQRMFSPLSGRLTVIAEKEA